MDRPPFRLPDLPSDLPADLPGLPHTGNGPVFREPWEAQAFAMAVKLHETGAFTWPEWAAALARAIEDAPAGRSEVRRVGKEGGRTWRARGSPPNRNKQNPKRTKPHT